MFRDDRCSIERPVEIKEEGETVGWQDDLIVTDLPCHLSVVSKSAVDQTQSTATVLLDYVLYIDTKYGITILENDKITVTTAQGQRYQLRAGESHKYRFTTQTRCEVEKVV